MTAWLWTAIEVLSVPPLGYGIAFVLLVAMLIFGAVVVPWIDETRRWRRWMRGQAREREEAVDGR